MSTPPLGSTHVSPELPADGVKEPPSPAGVVQRHWRWLLPLLGLALVALAYGVGRLQGSMELGRAQEESSKALQAGQTRLAACDADRHLLEARRSLALVALSLDRRNFGVAETHRRSALRELESSSPSNGTNVAELASNVRGLDLAVDPDPGAHRERVIAVSEALDGILTARGGQAKEPLVRAE